MENLWNEIVEMLHKSENKIRIDRIETPNTTLLDKLNINKNSVLGQIVLHTSGIVVDNYIRIYGNGDEKVSHNIYAYNQKLKKQFGDGFLFIADDVFGGLFAINCGGYSSKMNNILYFAPDILEWEDIEINYAEFITYILSRNVNEFYQSYKWSEFNDYIAHVTYKQGILIYPFLWSKECDIEKADKKIVPFDELIQLNLDYKKKFEF